MFTGIVEGMGRVLSLEPDDQNLHITVACSFANELKTDQSLAHNGVCLTVTSTKADRYTVTAIAETLRRTNLGLLRPDDLVNLERSMVINGRIDGHMVQGHVDTTGTCNAIEDQGGSWLFTFVHKELEDLFTVPKGSITVNGVSLTVVDATVTGFSVAVIPFTQEHTNFRNLKAGSVVNLEFDIVGKYVARYLALRERK